MKAIWAVSMLDTHWTEVQWMLFLTSVRTFKQFHPNVETKLYVSALPLKYLNVLGVLDYWDEVEEVDFISTGFYTKASWDYPKVEALRREKETVLYVDYDIVFKANILTQMKPDVEYVYCEEAFEDCCYFTQAELDKLLAPFKVGKVAVNTGILRLKPASIEEWYQVYRRTFPKLAIMSKSQLNTKFSLTVGQGSLGKILTGYRQFCEDVTPESYTHFLGWAKYSPEMPAYQELLGLIQKDQPEIYTLVRQNSKKLKSVL